MSKVLSSPSSAQMHMLPQKPFQRYRGMKATDAMSASAALKRDAGL